MVLDEKCQLLGLFRFGQNKTRNNAQWLCTVKRNLFDFKKQNFWKFKKSHFYQKGLTYAFGQKMAIFSLFTFGQNKTRNIA